MKFSIVIPTQNRSRLLDVVLKYAMSLDYHNYEVIVSDNSTDEREKDLNRYVFSAYSSSENVKLVSPPQVLSAPEHFEYALGFATGDYVTFLTDKMVILPDTLSNVRYAIETTGSDIINWEYYSFVTDDYTNPSKSGTLYVKSRVQNNPPSEIDPIVELKSKASGFLSRGKESKNSYVTGKICFGFYSNNLIKRIIKKSGALFGGVTHDYSAMVQACCLANKIVVLKKPAIIFISLPVDKSLGMLTHINSSAALSYYESFFDSEAIINNLPIPGLYSSQHNMVANDYIKYLALYDRIDFFILQYWIISIENDIFLKGKVWKDNSERESQINILKGFVKTNTKHKLRSAGFKYYFYFLNDLKVGARKVIGRFARKVFYTIPFGPRILRVINKSIRCQSIEDAVKAAIVSQS